MLDYKRQYHRCFIYTHKQQIARTENMIYSQCRGLHWDKL